MVHQKKKQLCAKMGYFNTLTDHTGAHYIYTIIHVTENQHRRRAFLEVLGCVLAML